MTEQFHIKPRDIKTYVNTQVFYANAHRNITHNSQKLESIQMFISWLVDEQNIVHTKEYYSSHEKEKLLWMTLKNMLRERSQI